VPVLNLHEKIRPHSNAAEMVRYSAAAVMPRILVPRTRYTLMHHSFCVERYSRCRSRTIHALAAQDTVGHIPAPV
jgi:hypothetical protein